jgi:hypothetical protein
LTYYENTKKCSIHKFATQTLMEKTSLQHKPSWKKQVCNTNPHGKNKFATQTLMEKTK